MFSPLVETRWLGRKELKIHGTKKKPWKMGHNVVFFWLTHSHRMGKASLLFAPVYAFYTKSYCLVRISEEPRAEAMAVLVDDFLTTRQKSHIYLCTYPSVPVHLLFLFGTTSTGKTPWDNLGLSDHKAASTSCVHGEQLPRPRCRQ